MGWYEKGQENDPAQVVEHPLVKTMIIRGGQILSPPIVLTP
jgi:hypothetical protein